MGSLLIGIIYFWIWIFGELGIFRYFPVLGLVGWGPGGFVNWFIAFFDIVFLGAGYFPTLGLVGQGLGDFVNYNILLDIGYLGAGYYRIFSNSGFGWPGAWGWQLSGRRRPTPHLITSHPLPSR